jgi:hypothetical protein
MIMRDVLWICLLGLAGSFVGAAGCTSHLAPTVTVHLTSRIDPEPHVFLIAGRDQERIQQSLRNAGVDLADEASGPYSLRVLLGFGRGATECGEIRSLRYELRSDRHRILTIKGRGPTGTCEANILDEMSVALVGHFARIAAPDFQP